MNRNLSFEQRLHNACATQTVEDYKARHAYLHSICYAREEWDTMWLDSANTTWTHWFGRMVGYDEVYLNSVTHQDGMIIPVKNDFMVRRLHRLYRGHDLRATGASGVHVLCSDVIEAADDGQSVRSYYLTPGTLMAIGVMGQRSGEWIWERYASEFVYVNGEWKWFHEQVCPDITGFYDTGNWAYDAYLKYLEKYANPTGDDMEWPRPQFLTEPGEFHFSQSITQTVQYTVLPPEPYETLDDAHTISPGRTDYTVQETVFPDRSLPGKRLPGPPNG